MIPRLFIFVHNSMRKDFICTTNQTNSNEPTNLRSYYFPRLVHNDLPNRLRVWFRERKSNKCVREHPISWRFVSVDRSFTMWQVSHATWTIFFFSFSFLAIAIVVEVYRYDDVSCTLFILPDITHDRIVFPGVSLLIRFYDLLLHFCSKFTFPFSFFFNFLLIFLILYFVTVWLTSHTFSLNCRLLVGDLNWNKMENNFKSLEDNIRKSLCFKVP